MDGGGVAHSSVDGARASPSRPSAGARGSSSLQPTAAAFYGAEPASSSRQPPAPSPPASEQAASSGSPRKARRRQPPAPELSNGSSDTQYQRQPQQPHRRQLRANGHEPGTAISQSSGSNHRSYANSNPDATHFQHRAQHDQSVAYANGRHNRRETQLNAGTEQRQHAGENVDAHAAQASYDTREPLQRSSGADGTAADAQLGREGGGGRGGGERGRRGGFSRGRGRARYGGRGSSPNRRPTHAADAAANGSTPDAHVTAAEASAPTDQAGAGASEASLSAAAAAVAAATAAAATAAAASSIERLQPSPRDRQREHQQPDQPQRRQRQPQQQGGSGRVAIVRANRSRPAPELERHSNGDATLTWQQQQQQGYYHQHDHHHQQYPDCEDGLTLTWQQRQQPQQPQQRPFPREQHKRHQHQAGPGAARWRGQAATAPGASANGDAAPPATAPLAAPAADGAAVAAPDGAADADAAAAEQVVCLLCCEVAEAVAVPSCDHHQMCARCSLRLRLCYKDKRCPLCKAVSADLVILRPPAHGPIPAFADLMSRPAALWAKPSWAEGVHVVMSSHPAGGTLPLHVSLLQMTARSCSVCDAGGRRPLPNDRALRSHLEKEHGLALCGICAAAGRKFPLEMEAYTQPDLQAHVTEVHPRCEFCHISFYGDDELYQHMNLRHYLCHLCQRAGRPHLYFNDAAELRQHFRDEHYACTEPECEEVLVVFVTEEELRQHYMQRHTSRMPRWDPNRARPLLLDFTIGGSSARPPTHSRARRPTVGPGGDSDGAADAAGGAQEQRRRRRQQQQADRPGGAAGGDGSSTHGAAEQPSSDRRQQRQQPQQREGADGAAAGHLWPAGEQEDGNWRMIDDDLGSMANLPPPAAASGAPAGPHPDAAPAALSGAWAQRSQRPRVQEDFPTLQAAAARPDAPAGTADRAAGAPSGSSAWTQLVKVSIKCPCGRRVQHLALRPGQEAPTLDCDRQCEREGRKQQLASAFGVDDPDTHVPSFQRHRAPTYPPSLIQVAHESPEWVEMLERELSTFLADKTLQRQALQPMSAKQRAFVAQLAEQYGITTHSSGQEPRRFVQLYKSPTSGRPRDLLSAVAAQTSPEVLEELLSRPSAHALRLVNVEPGVDPRKYLRQWEEHFTLQWDGDTAVTLEFDGPAALKACSDSLGGGIRGAFRVERISKATTDTAAAAVTQQGGSGTGDGGGSSRANGVADRGGSSRGASAIVEPALQRAIDASSRAAGWHTVSKGSKRGGPGMSAAESDNTPAATGRAATATAAGFADPWASDDEADVGKSSSKAAAVVDDWESADEDDIVVAPKPATAGATAAAAGAAVAQQGFAVMAGGVPAPRQALHLPQSNLWQALEDDT